MFIRPDVMIDTIFDVNFLNVNKNAIHIPNDESNREYIGIRLTNKLVKDSFYTFSMYCSLADLWYEEYMHDIQNGIEPWLSVYATHNIGIYLSADSIYENSWEPLPYIPQIQNPTNNPINDVYNWIKVEGTYMASGGEEYIYIGNYNTNENTDLAILYAGENPEPWVYFYIDDVLVTKTTSTGIEENSTNKLNIYPNPAQEFVSIDLPKNINQAQLSIYNLTGQLISQKQITQPNQQIPITELGNGMYIFVIQNRDKVIGRQRVVVGRY
jgi:hypothetical protein